MLIGCSYGNVHSAGQETEINSSATDVFTYTDEINSSESTLNYDGFDSEYSDLIISESYNNKERLESINVGDRATLSVIRHDDDEIVYDFIYSVSGKSEQARSVTSSNMSHCVKHTENGADFLIVYGYAPGHGCPASIVTIIDGKPCVLSEYSDASDDNPSLYYYPQGDIICKRGNGVSCGSNNAIPYYWDSEKNGFYPYALHEITLGELKALDQNNIVPEPDSAISIYRRDNGLVHVNYSNITEVKLGSKAPETVNRTYVETENGLREYAFETDACYGHFLEILCVDE